MPEPESANDTAEAVLRALEELGHTIARPGLQFGAAVIDAGAIDQLRPEESAAVADAVASRRSEFASGRALLRRVIGVDVALPVDAARRPVLPPGVSGSLAHDADIVVAAVTRDERCTIGVDIEVAGAVEQALATTVLRADERGIDPTLAFCVKEAAYKAWSSAGGRFLEHHDVRITIDGSTIRAEVLGAGPDDPTGEMAGGSALAAGRVIALIVHETSDST